jgi:nucleotide-binding universal stress UspA family protein
VILDYAAQIEADLVVIGTHGRTGFERLMLGSVTEKVVRKARCPVLTVPRGAELAAGQPVFRRVLCGVDFSDASDRALEYALSLAEEANGTLTLVHVLEWLGEPSLLGPSPFDLQAYRRALTSEAQRLLESRVPADARDWCQATAVVREGKPYQELLRAATDTGADLLVLGVHGRGVIDRMLFGSTLQQVVRQAACPVLTVRS